MAQSILAALLGFDGSKPVIPDYQSVDPAEEQRKATEGNLGVLDRASQLKSKVDQINTDALETALRRAIPNYDAIQKQIGDNLLSEIQGKLSIGTQGEVIRSRAAKSFAGGVAGSGFSFAGEARDLGLKSYELEQRATNTAGQWMQSTKNLAAPHLFDVTSSFFTPQQRAAITMDNNKTQWNVQKAKNWIASLPDAWEAAVGGLMDWIATTSLNVAGAYVGGGMGTGGTPGQNVGGNANASEAGGTNSFNGFGNYGSSPQGSNVGSGEGYYLGG